MSYPGSYASFSQLARPHGQAPQYWQGYSPTDFHGYRHYPKSFAPPNGRVPYPGFFPSSFGQPNYPMPPFAPMRHASPAMTPMFRVNIFFAENPAQQLAPRNPQFAHLQPNQQYFPPVGISTMRNDSPFLEDESLHPFTDDSLESKISEAKYRTNSQSTAIQHVESLDPPLPIPSQQLPDSFVATKLTCDDVSVSESIKSTSNCRSEFLKGANSQSTFQCSVSKIKDIMLAYL